MRRLAAILGIIATTVALGVAVSPPAGAASPTDGTYTSITPYRAVDTRYGAHGNRKGALVSGAFTQVQLADTVPTTASAALVSLTALNPTSYGALLTYANGAAVPSKADMYYRAKALSTVTAVVPLNDARFRLRNAGPGTTDVIVDVVGYYGPLGAAGKSGLLTSLPNRRVLATTVVPAGGARSISTGFVGTVVLQTHVFNPTRNGALAVYRFNGSVPGSNSTYYGTGTRYSGSTLARTDEAGRITVVNRGPAPIQLALDMTATFPGDSTTAANGLQAVAPQRLVSARSIAPGAVTSVAVAGQRGIARARLGAAAVSVVVGSPNVGQVTVGAPGRTSLATRNVSFVANQFASATLVVPVTNGAFEIRNGSTVAVQVYVDVLGYLPSNSLTPPSSSQSAARYLNDLTQSGVTGANRSTLRDHGCTDASAGATFALLDVGAQSYTKPLSTTNPGVALAKTDTVRLTYAQLVEAVKGYLDGVADGECNSSGNAVRVAVGTNNSGNFTDKANTTYPAYAGSARGKDWFDLVVKPLQQYAASKNAGLTVTAANDIENGDENGDFDTVYQNVKNWEDAYLSAAAGSSDDKLIYNGSANNCPAYFGDTTSDCDYWTLAQFVALTTNQNRVQVLPQIYFASQAAQWTNIAGAAATSGKTVPFLGALTQRALVPAQYSADQGWTALNRGLSSVVDTPSVPRSVPFVVD